MELPYLTHIYLFKSLFVLLIIVITCLVLVLQPSAATWKSTHSYYHQSHRMWLYCASLTLPNQVGLDFIKRGTWCPLVYYSHLYNQFFRLTCDLQQLRVLLVFVINQIVVCKWQFVRRIASGGPERGCVMIVYGTIIGTLLFRRLKDKLAVCWQFKSFLLHCN